MRRAEAIQAVSRLLRDEPVIHANGMICRESFTADDRPENFYMIGSMGLASSIALGLALCHPRRRIVVFDGDGNLLMNMGSLAMVGDLHPQNLLHIVFDNEAHGSTGGQPTQSRSVSLDEVARASGYRVVRRVESLPDLTKAVSDLLREDGPSFLLVKVGPGEEPVERIPHPPEQIRDRFMAALNSHKR